MIDKPILRSRLQKYVVEFFHIGNYLAINDTDLIEVLVDETIKLYTNSELEFRRKHNPKKYGRAGFRYKVKHTIKHLIDIGYLYIDENKIRRNEKFVPKHAKIIKK